MSQIKRYLEDVSEKMGLGGEITAEVEEAAAAAFNKPKVGDLYHTMGKAFVIRHIAKTSEEANEFCLANPTIALTGFGVIHENKDGQIIIADLEASIPTKTREGEANGL